MSARHIRPSLFICFCLFSWQLLPAQSDNSFGQYDFTAVNHRAYQVSGLLAKHWVRSFTETGIEHHKGKLSDPSELDLSRYEPFNNRLAAGENELLYYKVTFAYRDEAQKDQLFLCSYTNVGPELNPALKRHMQELHCGDQVLISDVWLRTDGTTNYRTAWYGLYTIE